MAVKNVKKKKARRLKRQVRKTLGALFLASAVAVAAIPTGSIEGGNTQAAVTTNADGTSSYTHVVNTGYHPDGDTSTHKEEYPIQTTDTAKSVYIHTTGDAPSAPNVGVTSNIPICETGSTIYCDGYFLFAYVDKNGSSTGKDRFAVILGYNNDGPLKDNTLVIPKELSAYLNYNDNDAGNVTYVAVGQSGNYLFYQTDAVTQYFTKKTDTIKETKKNPNGEILYWVNGDKTKEYTWAQIEAMQNPDDPLATVVTFEEIKEETEVTTYTYYAPCTQGEESKWENATLYYFATKDYKPGANPEYKNPTDTPDVCVYDMATINVAYPDNENYGRILNTPVRYIGNQYLISSGGGWKIATSADNTNGIITSSEHGIFQGKGNIGTLVISDELVGIGDYAFYECSSLTGINLRLANGLNTIGNHAFDNCRKMANILLPESCNINAIGAYAFRDCRELKAFVLPSSVKSIGDGAFKGCENLASVTLNTPGGGLT